MTTAHRNEYFRKLQEHQRLTLESVTEQRDEVRTDLEFCRGLFQLQEQQMDSLREQRDLWKAEAERWREQAGENFQVTAWKQIIEQEKNRMRGL